MGGIGFGALGYFVTKNAQHQLESSTAPITNTKTTTSSDLPAGWTQVSAENMSMGVAPGWKPIDLTSADFMDALKKESQNNPDTEGMQDSIAKLASNKQFKIFIFHAADPSTHFAPTINVLAVPNIGTTDLQAATDANMQQMKSMATGDIQRESTDLKAGPAQLLRWLRNTNTPSGSIMNRTLTYLMVKNQTLYVITCMFPQNQEAELGPDVEAMAKTFDVK